MNLLSLKLYKSISFQTASLNVSVFVFFSDAKNEWTRVTTAFVCPRKTDRSCKSLEKNLERFSNKTWNDSQKLLVVFSH